MFYLLEEKKRVGVCPLCSKDHNILGMKLKTIHAKHKLESSKPSPLPKDMSLY